MESFIASFKDSFESWGYIALFVYCMGSGYVGILAAGALSSLGVADLGISILVAAVGNFVGSSLLVLATRYQKKDFERFLLPHRRKIALMHLWLRRYGATLILLNKYIYGVKFLVPAAIGLSRYDMKKFLFLNTLASIIWAASLGGLAFYAGQFVIGLIEEYGQYSYFGLVALFILIVFAFMWFGKKTRSTKK